MYPHAIAVLEDVHHELTRNWPPCCGRLAEHLNEAEGKKSKDAKLRAKYVNPDTGAFKGGKGERFDNCVKYQLAKGITPRTAGDSKEDAARKVCAAIGRSAGKI